MSKQNQTDTLPFNVLRVQFTSQLIGLICRGRVDVGILVARDRTLRKDRFEATHFVYEGGVYIRLTTEILDEFRKEGSYESFILKLEKTKSEKSVRARTDLRGKTSSIVFDLSCLKRMHDFLAHGAAMGYVIARFLDGVDPQKLVDAARREQSRGPSHSRQGKGGSARAALRALDKGPRKPRGNEPGGLGTFADKVGDKLNAAKSMTRAQQAKHGDKKGKKAQASKPEPSSDAAPSAQAEELKPTLTSRQINMYADGYVKVMDDQDAAVEFLARISLEVDRLAVLAEVIRREDAAKEKAMQAAKKASIEDGSTTVH